MGTGGGHDGSDAMTDADADVRKRSVEIAGHRTSVSIEQPFWDALKDLARAQGISVNDLITTIDGARGKNLSSAIRIYVLRMAQKGQNGR
jgi:predicted DNA-binding ribbon-helix-helix protein